MSIIVEHDKRRREILEKALDVFIDQGFGDVTFQKIADRCGITRTTLYTYFKNKTDIFNFSIKQLLQELENDIARVRVEKSLGYVDKLLQIMILIIERLEENRRLLQVVLNYLLYLSKSDTEIDYRVRRRTVRLRHILASIVIEGIRAGEIAPINVRNADDLLYGLLESAIFRMVVLKRSTVEDMKATMTLAVKQLAARPLLP